MSTFHMAVNGVSDALRAWLTVPDHESSTSLKSRYHLPSLRLYRDQALRLYTGAPPYSSPAALVYWPRVCDG